MIKLNGNKRQRSSERQYRIGFTDLTMDSLWDSDSEKYKVICRMIHVTKATLHIGCVQMLISFIFLVFFTYHYVMAVTGQLSVDHWINQYTARYISQLLLAVSLQLVLVVVMIHGVRTERKSLLLPYIIYALVAILVGCAQLGSDFMNLDSSRSVEMRKIYSGHSQFLSHLIGTMIQTWCLSVVWRCYGYLGDKKMARQMSELSATQAAFQYPEQFLGYAPMPQPPPYSDTVIGPVTQQPQTYSVSQQQPVVVLSPPNSTEIPKAQEVPKPENVDEKQTLNNVV